MTDKRPIINDGGVLREMRDSELINSNLYISDSELEIVNVTTTISITDFQKVYSLQGTGSYTVTLPEATSANEGQVIYFYKEGNSNINQRITLTTSAGQNILANRTQYQELFFRFKGEAIILMSNNARWNVISDSNLLDTNLYANNETSFINSINKLNDLGVGGSIHLISEIEITGSWAVNLNGIRIFGDNSEETQIKFTEDYYRFLLFGYSFHFDSVRFTGVMSDREFAFCQNFMEIDTIASEFMGIFNNCTFRDIAGKNPNESLGNITLTSNTGQTGTEIVSFNFTFNNCDVFTGGSGDVAYGMHIDNQCGDNICKSINIFGFSHKRVDSNFNLFRLTGVYTLENNNGITDGSVIFDTDVGLANDLFNNRIISVQNPLITYHAEKTSIVNADEILISDSADGQSLKRISFENLTSDLANKSNSIDYQNEVLLTSATSLDSDDFGKSFRISGSSDYTVTLPAATGNSGKLLAVRIVGSALFTIKGNGSEEIDGENERVMWLNETATLLCDGVGWTKVGGKSVPMYARSSGNSSQSLANATTINLTINNIGNDAIGIVNLSENSFEVKRKGKYTLTLFTRLSSLNAGSNLIQSISKNNSISPERGALYGTTGKIANSGWLISQVFDADKDDEFNFRIYHDHGSPRNMLANPVMSIIEIPTW